MSKVAKKRKDWYRAVLILGASSILSGTLLLFSGEDAPFYLGLIKLVIAVPIVAYTVKNRRTLVG